MTSKPGKDCLRLDALEKLVLKGPAKSVSQSLASFSTPRLATVKLYITDKPPVESLLGVISMLNRHRLKSIIVHHLGSCPDDSASYINWGQVFIPLSQHTQVEDLRLQFHRIPLRMNNDDVEKLTLTFPALRKLEIIATSASTSVAPSILCLTSFARNCSQLQYLQLDLDNEAPFPLEPPVFSHKLRTVDLFFPTRNTSSTFACSLAHFLDSLFPWLDTSGCEDGIQDWTQMLRIIDGKRDSRRVERRRLLQLS
ncbi:hypothetical protein GLOTRDRAFT_127602 [Gloeophyllum trabeum ATCC 11539]|uniref:F-box domain-containing protein n=1 Tax=Gloeophyllum trabeum (strain ATCC 11539 / FP-39264 / Madison 617) TaxID=670483 RepID=S7QBB5_GLOTA|nr:uncharacterized protein GLOTRDRAFT_127602 [Gloeophyllum trabeum ATCC 11539]EPQ57236.1 hypothetical protein GLOTRDRAFT_127602 [Gloeophyllum trabeum ATCC 11539]